jgi:hypothetical protein
LGVYKKGKGCMKKVKIAHKAGNSELCTRNASVPK